MTIILFFGMGASTLKSQDTNNPKPLAVVLHELEANFDVQFNFLEATVEGVQVLPPNTSFNLTESLEYLRSSTGLVFTLLDSNFVSVTQKNVFTICGYLLDKDTQEPLESATIQGNSRSAITNTDGYFELSLTSSEEIITIRYLGYKTIQRSSNYFKKEGCHPIFMLPQASDLGAVILSNYLIDGISKLNDGSFELDISKFTILPGLIEPDVLQTVQAFPGIQSVNETVSNINIRGGTHDQNLILWDDIKMYQSGHFFGLISVFNPQITQKVSLQKNGT
ncbi:MAG: TonB-dependent receptor plug domain-containing protein, partial [Flavobacteriaceae bacterium]|nr:TonB-dependent receptor plug domain-containing protein [Flavobacteriaceae bacterium]